MTILNQIICLIVSVIWNEAYGTILNSRCYALFFVYIACVQLCPFVLVSRDCSFSQHVNEQCSVWQCLSIIFKLDKNFRNNLHKTLKPCKKNVNHMRLKRIRSERLCIAYLVVYAVTLVTLWLSYTMMVVKKVVLQFGMILFNFVLSDNNMVESNAVNYRGVICFQPTNIAI